MFIRVSGAQFTEKLTSAIKNKEVVNYYLRGDVLYLQTMGVMRHNIRLKIIETDMKELDASYVMSKILHLLNTNEDVTLYFQGDLLKIQQSNFAFNAMKAYEERIDNNAFSDRSYTSFNRRALIRVVTDAKYMDNLARSLGVGYSPIQFIDGNAYLMYSNTMAKWDASFVNMSIAISVLKEVLDGTDENSKYFFDEVSRTLYFYISESEVLTVEVNEPNLMVEETYKKLLLNSQREQLVTLGTKYRQPIETIARSYDKALVDVSFCEDGNIKIYIDNTVTRFAYGSGAKELKTIRISTIQLSTMLRILGDARTDVEIGENKLWLRQTVEMTDLIIAGMLF